MTISPEEKALLADAYEVKKEQKQWNSADTTAAIQRGLAKGRTSKRNLGRSGKWIVFLSAASVILGFMLFGAFGDNRQQRLASPEPVIHWGKLEPFRELLPRDPERVTLTSALNHNYVQLVDQTVKTGKYEFTLDAVMADENRIIILYSARTDMPNKMYSIVNDKLTDASTGNLIDNGSINGIHFSDENNVLYGRTTFDRSRSKPLPDQLNFQFQLSSVVPDKPGDTKSEKQESQGEKQQERKYAFSKKMNVSFALDPKFSTPQTEIIDVNRTFKFGEHEVSIADVEISPLVTRVRFEYKPKKQLDYETELFLEDIIRPFEITSISNKGVKTILSPVGSGGTGDGMTYSFNSDFLNDPKSMILKVQGKPGKVYGNQQDAAKDEFEIKIK
ncbi:DUF4179 domain-containing protein [Paenibacillus barcinonensis]|uniref:DUF4179 domain-containing protein n=1 Tax=Paenibacillus barcinonensis TaxID=198119 RepID=UPI001C0FE406|nr:DUF4179 domain-containing protein [Paenibacillus barcinonensis]MBU5354002.1 DUF4179 domain-containing protein [Paenibacillus barcinonensis]